MRHISSFAWIFLIFAVFSLPQTSLAANYEPVGLKPVAPNGLFSTFGANTAEEGKASFDFSFEKVGGPHFYRASLNMGYGFSNNVELFVSVPYFWDWQNSMGVNIDGVEDVAIGVKHRFFSESALGPSVSYILLASPISGKGDVSTDGAYGGGLCISKRVGPVNGHANIIYTKPGNDKLTRSIPNGTETVHLRDEVTFSVGFDFAAAHNFQMLFEYYNKKSRYSKRTDDQELRFGYRFLTADNIYTTVGAGVDVNGSTPDYNVMLSVTMSFPSHKKAIRKVYEVQE